VIDYSLGSFRYYWAPIRDYPGSIRDSARPFRDYPSSIRDSGQSDKFRTHYHYYYYHCPHYHLSTPDLKFTPTHV
ncbi:hypothetical protein, partial [Bacillus weihaiensis]|uniref:hypothetical protein n=1 Tax=Bacillus weihaiensis TaxID=1547283 RepID=UPI00235372E3